MRKPRKTTIKDKQISKECTAQIPPPVIPISIPESDVPKSLPKNIPIPESDIPKNLPKPNIPYPSRRDNQKSRDKASNQMEKSFQIFQRFALQHYFRQIFTFECKSCSYIKSLLIIRKSCLSSYDSIEQNSRDASQKASEKLEIPRKFPYSNVIFPGIELADRSITYPKGLAEDVFVKVGKFHFPTDFVVVNFEADPRVPLILGRSFLRTGRALIDVYGEEITLRVDSEAVTFNLDQTTRYSSTNDKSVNRIDIIDAVCEEYAPELLGFPNTSGGNPTPSSEPFTFEFILEEIEAYLKDDSIHRKCIKKKLIMPIAIRRKIFV
ncbi:reverse transcriptase domain-containing protein [Tanacetum coccineum]|uniref:Reverse transcriptase domain-containing protein n=1 Tax=Tanacetum coccineum TaxID=301880 RepID=A0ABQ5CWT2_9ASTR